MQQMELIRTAGPFEKPDKPIAFKEWAVAVKALGEGRQILMMRKGGIHEETRKFQVESASFYFYPTYEHQNPQLLKAEFRDDLQATLAGWKASDEQVAIAYAAQVTDELMVTETEALERIADHHIWTDNFAEARLKWKPYSPLHLLLVRVYRLEKSVILPVSSTYLGCKSWVLLEREIEANTFTPVLSDEDYLTEKETIIRLLGE